MHKKRGFSPSEDLIVCCKSLASSIQPSESKAKQSNRRNEGPLTGFTLIELLVVISIIALLMATLMPALARVTNKAKSVMCQGYLKQWSMVFSMYAEDNNGLFFPRWLDAVGLPNGTPNLWFDRFRAFYGDTKGFSCCPKATKPRQVVDLVTNTAYPGPGADVHPALAAWGETGREVFKRRTYKGGDYGSYGYNSFMYTMHCDKDPTPGPEYCGNVNIRGAERFPMLADAINFDGWAYHTDPPPPYDGFGGDNHISRFCQNRHEGSVNGVFLDFSVRSIGLKELWTLKWHQLFDTHGPYTTAGGMAHDDWPEWMRKFKDY